MGFHTETVTQVKHWNDTLFSFNTTRDPSFRFKNGHFTMMGLPYARNGRPLVRAYSIASANYEEEMEFFSIKVEDGPLTSQLQKLQVGDEVVIGHKPTGTLLIDNLLPGRNLYLLGTGTGLAPFISIIKDPETYEKFERIILVHGVRYCSELAYKDYIEQELPQHEYLGEQIRQQLLYYPTVTRETWVHQGRITDLIESGRLQEDLGLPELSVADDRFMLCGSPSLLKDMCSILDNKGFKETRQGNYAEYVIERAFVET